MFWKKSPKSEKPEQSQSVSNVNLTGGMLQMSQAGGNLQANQTGDLQTQQQGLTGADVVALLEKLETNIKEASIDAAMQEELLDYLRPAKRAAAKETPNKELVGQNLKQISEILKTLQDTTDAGKSLWQTGVDIFKTVAPWLGVAAAFFGL